MLGIRGKNTPDKEDQELMFLLCGGIHVNIKILPCANELVQVKLSLRLRETSQSFPQNSFVS